VAALVNQNHSRQAIAAELYNGVVSAGAAPVNCGRDQIDPHDGAANFRGKYPRARDIGNWRQTKDDAAPKPPQ
jgi:hypothetical protein